MTRFFFCALIVAFGTSLLAMQQASELYQRQPSTDTRWISFENPTGAKGEGGKENRGGKGHAFEALKAGESKVLLDMRGSGSIRRMWFTLRERDPRMLRALRLEIFWDGAAAPAVSVPFGDFFGAILGRPVKFENELFANPEGRSFNCYIPMPFRKAARVTITNESSRDVIKLFYEIDVAITKKADPDALYFHAAWRRERWTELERDFEILPPTKGEGRFLGAHVGVIVNPDNVGWWGEGAVKIYLDGDTGSPTLVGTGTEDYIGTGWGQGFFSGRFQGSLVVDAKNGQYGFYRYHIPDPVYFHKDLRVTIQQMGGASKKQVMELMNKGVPLKPVSLDYARQFIKLLELDSPVDLAKHDSPPSAWTNVYRRDDYSAVALFYLNAAVNKLPKLAAAEKRVEAMLEQVPAQAGAPLP